MRYPIALAASMLFFSGCAFSSHVPPPPPDLSGDDATESTTEPSRTPPVDPGLAPTSAARIEDAWLAGEMLDIGTFEGDAYEVERRPAYVGTGAITLHAGTRGGDDFGWAMLRLSTGAVGGFEGDELSAGTSATSPLSAMGCVGPEHGSYTFDQTTDDVETTVEPGPTPQSRLFHFRASYPSQGYIEGGFVMIFPEDGFEADGPSLEP